MGRVRWWGRGVETNRRIWCVHKALLREYGLKLIALLCLRYLSVGREILFRKYRNQFNRAINSVCVGFEYVVKYRIRLSDVTSEKLVCTSEYIN